MTPTLLLLTAALALNTGCAALAPLLPQATEPPVTLEDLPAYDGIAAVELSAPPDFPLEDIQAGAFETYSSLDYLGRPGTAYAKVGAETMPTQERGAIGMVKPAGWHTVRYDFIDGKYLYNRCHLIGYQITGENANEENLITGTRYLNTQGMLPYEDRVADYVKETGNHVLYRATPLYDGTDLLCRGIELEALSVEDGGQGVCFHVFAYNVQPGVVIDYATGESWAEGESSPTPEPTPSPSPGPTPTPEPTPTPAAGTYVVNEKSKRFHLPDCQGVATMSEKNRRDTDESREALIEQGYIPCGTCKP